MWSVSGRWAVEAGRAERESLGQEGPKAFLLARSEPEGVYTCLRTRAAAAGGASSSTWPIVQLDAQMRRLVAGAARLGGQAPKTDALVAAVAAAQAAVRREQPSETGRLLITLFVPPEDPPQSVWWHAMRLPPAAAQVAVLLSDLRTPQGNRQARPHVKSAGWIREREPLADALAAHPARPAELVMVAGLDLLEGLITNMFVVLPDGTVQTAPNGVLPGTMRELVIGACHKLGIPLLLRAPRLGDLWADAFLTSVTKPVVPVHELHVELASRPSPWQGALKLPGHEHTRRLREAVLADL